MVDQKPYNAGDEVQVKTRKRRLDLERKQETNDLQSVMGTAYGRRFIWRWLGITGVHRTSFNTNALSMAHAEGQRGVGLMLEAEIMETDPKLYLTMQAEAISQEEIDNA